MAGRGLRRSARRREPGALRDDQQRRPARRPGRRRRGDGFEEPESDCDCGGRETSSRNPAGVEPSPVRCGGAALVRSRTSTAVIGTVANLAVFNRLGALPTRNFQQATFEDADALSGETLTNNNFSRRHGCASCTIRCERLFTSQRRRRANSASSTRHCSRSDRCAASTIPRTC